MYTIINMFPFQCIVKRIPRWGMFSHLLLVQKNVNNPFTAMAFYRLLNNSSCQCYCIESDSRATYTDPSNLISEQYEVQECSDETPVSEIKYAKFNERCIKKIEKFLKCSSCEALALYKQYPRLFHEHIIDTVNKIASVTGTGISEECLVKNIEVLELDKEEIIYKIEEMNAWGLNDHQKMDMLGLLKLEPKQFDEISVHFKDNRKRIPTGNHLIYFSNLLLCSLKEIVDMSMEYPHLLTERFEDTREKFELLLDHDIRPITLRNNLWLLDYSVKTIKEWLNVPDDKISRYYKNDKQLMIRLQKLKETDKIEKTILEPDQTREEFLAKKLQIDLKLMKYLISQNPEIFTQDLRDITKVIDFLYLNGYTGAQICVNCVVLKRDINSLQERLNEFKSHGNYKLPLSILSGIKSKYQCFLRKFCQSG